ncbi:MAG: hypothetical protein ABSA01_15255 [Anaerolineales bacterium]|jgi:hypothetical protein
MKKAFHYGLVILVGTGLLLPGCSSIHGTNSGQPPLPSSQPQAQPSLKSNQPQTQPTPASGQALAQPTPTGAGLDQSANDADQTLNNMQSTLQAIDVSTPASIGDQSTNDVNQSANDADQNMNNLQRTVQSEATP